VRRAGGALALLGQPGWRNREIGHLEIDNLEIGGDRGADTGFDLR
jgi:hypothetical protein